MGNTFYIFDLSPLLEETGRGLGLYEQSIPRVLDQVRVGLDL